MTKKVLRCAIYTRKSSEEGLDQEFNSLHAQREACEAYVKSQVGEGWSALPTAYDDGGVSGGTMERDGLKALLADIQAGKVDVVVVYKVDRLTRSLHDFARIVEVFDKHQVSFVSVTQAFNTTTSMGRLTLNVLLSFAQFEREVTGERIRDKIAASKAKGLWMGGTVPFGYKPIGRTLEIVPDEAAAVRRIFNRYLQLRSVHQLVDELDRDGVRSKRWTTKAGEETGGLAFNRGSLVYLLKNPIYVGKIVHHGRVHNGAHQAIVDQEQFDAVQALLKAQVSERRRRTHERAPLIGRIFDADGQVMSPTVSQGRGGRTYRYYVSTDLQRGLRRRVQGDTIRRLPAPAVEAWVGSLLVRIRPTLGADLAAIKRIEVHPHSVAVLLDLKCLAPKPEHMARIKSEIATRLVAGESLTVSPEGFWLHIPGRLQFRGGGTSIDGQAVSSGPRIDATLTAALKKAHRFVSQNSDETGALVRRPTNTYEQRLVRLSFLAPDLQSAILSGRQPARMQLEGLRQAKIPLSWDDQRRLVQSLP